MCRDIGSIEVDMYKVTGHQDMIDRLAACYMIVCVGVFRISINVCAYEFVSK
jgi:hypothetical protein